MTYNESKNVAGWNKKSHQPNQSEGKGSMQKDEVYRKVTEYLTSQFKIPPEKITPQAQLFKDLEMDSIDALDWFAAMESQIGLPIVENELKLIRTVQDVVDYVARNLR
jgi:acyl carrier protein